MDSLLCAAYVSKPHVHALTGLDDQSTLFINLESPQTFPVAIAKAVRLGAVKEAPTVT